MIRNKTVFLTITLLLLSVCVHSQEKSRYKCAYEVYVQRDTITHESYRKDTYIVQIDDDIAKGFYYRRFYIDSLVNTNRALYEQMVMDAMDRTAEYPGLSYPAALEKTGGHLYSNGPFRSTLYKDYKNNEMKVVDWISTTMFQFTDELQPQDWRILSDTMTILGYHSQKATCRYRGRDWIAWFTGEIPISEGPWKFYGLPGLITKISDSKDHYSFELTGFQKIEEPIDTQISKKVEKTTRKEFVKAMKGGQINRTELEKYGVTRPVTNNDRGGKVRYDYIETDYREWADEK